jgi:hypothetical protein
VKKVAWFLRALGVSANAFVISSTVQLTSGTSTFAFQLWIV